MVVTDIFADLTDPIEELGLYEDDDMPLGISKEIEVKKLDFFYNRQDAVTEQKKKD